MVEKIYVNLEIKDDETPSVEECKSNIYTKVRDLYNAYKVLEINIPIVEPPSKPKSDERMIGWINILSLNPLLIMILIYISIGNEKILGMKDNFNLQYYYGGRIVKINFRTFLGLFEMC